MWVVLNSLCCRSYKSSRRNVIYCQGAERTLEYSRCRCLNNYSKESSPHDLFLHMVSHLPGTFWMAIKGTSIEISGALFCVVSSSSVLHTPAVLSPRIVIIISLTHCNCLAVFGFPSCTAVWKVPSDTVQCLRTVSSLPLLKFF